MRKSEIPVHLLYFYQSIITKENTNKTRKQIRHIQDFPVTHRARHVLIPPEEKRVKVPINLSYKKYVLNLAL